MKIYDRKMIDVYLDEGEEFDYRNFSYGPWNGIYTMQQDRIVLHYPDGTKFIYKDRSGLFNV
jgi:hypothetical protein